MLVVIFVVIGSLYAYYSRSMFIDFRPNAPISVAFRAEGTNIMHQNPDGIFVPIQLRGVELTPSIPGHMAWDFSATVEDYLRWFGYIDAMGANSLYISSIMNPTFYNALYEFNTTNERPLLVLQGVPGHNYDSLTTALKEAIDIIHGNRVNLLTRTGFQTFFSNVSPWVLGFLVGAEFDPDMIVFMNHFVPDMPTSFEGEFFSAAEDASPFEVMLAQVMDSATAYETSRYKVQRPIGFTSNHFVDFLEYEWAYATQLRKYAQLDPENILPSPSMEAGIFAAYRLFFFTDDFISLLSEDQQEELAPIIANVDRSCIFAGYLDLLAQYHSMPVIAAGFGFSSSRAPHTMNRPPLTERQQGEALASATRQIEERGWAGAFISTWQDNWERRTWNTAFSSYVWRYHHWHNLQAVDQGYGLMAFDPGAYRRPVLIDGIADEWDESHLVHTSIDINIYAQYSNQGLYLLIRGNGVSPQNNLYLPINVTPRSGTALFYDLEFERPSNFLLIISGIHDSRLLVNRRFHATYPRFYEEMTGINPYTVVPPRWESEFVPITLAMQNTLIIDAVTFANLPDTARELMRLKSWDTGTLTHGIGDPASYYYNSLADFVFGDNLVEIRLPWMLLNFYDPSSMQVHDDYFVNFGVEGLSIAEMYIGIGVDRFGYAEADNRISMSPIPLQGWRNSVEFHERLKQSYFIMKETWGD